MPKNLHNTEKGIIFAMSNKDKEFFNMFNLKRKEVTMRQDEKPIISKAIVLLEIFKEETKKDYLKENAEEIIRKMRLLTK